MCEDIERQNKRGNLILIVILCFVAFSCFLTIWSIYRNAQIAENTLEYLLRDIRGFFSDNKSLLDADGKISPLAESYVDRLQASGKELISSNVITIFLQMLNIILVTVGLYILNRFRSDLEEARKNVDESSRNVEDAKKVLGESSTKLEESRNKLDQIQNDLKESKENLKSMREMRNIMTPYLRNSEFTLTLEFDSLNARQNASLLRLLDDTRIRDRIIPYINESLNSLKLRLQKCVEENIGIEKLQFIRLLDRVIEVRNYLGEEAKKSEEELGKLNNSIELVKECFNILGQGEFVEKYNEYQRILSEGISADQINLE